MIRKVRINGFRSLSDFEINIEPGLNILVGPNGSGKTNIILFFEFLTYLCTTELAEAVGRVGGAGFLFRKTRGDKIESKIISTIEGEFTSTFDEEKIWYEYEFEINLSEERDFVYFSSERIKIARSKDESKFKSKPNWDLDISYFSISPDEREYIINRIDFRKYYYLAYADGERKEKIDGIIRDLGKIISPELSIVYGMEGMVSEFSAVRAEMIGGEVFNIVPSAVRAQEDSASAPGIRKDGSGLAATIYFVKKFKEDQLRRPRVVRRWRGNLISSMRLHSAMHSARFGSYPPAISQRSSRLRRTRRTFDQIVEYAQLVNDQILGLDVKNNPIDNTIEVIFLHKDDTGEAVHLPVSAISDGTIKWISLITAILTYPTVFAIEEPENFIHPLMQRELLRIMRSDSRSRRRDSFVLMTTHSESLLDAADPEEVIVVSMRDGMTSCSRPRDPELLREEIRRTGFGLGHYYLTGALEDA